MYGKPSDYDQYDKDEYDTRAVDENESYRQDN